jgi:hypothetical protein
MGVQAMVLYIYSKGQQKQIGSVQNMEWTLEKLEIEFKRYEELENYHGNKGDSETAYFYMKQKWDVYNQMEIVRGNR